MSPQEQTDTNHYAEVTPVVYYASLILIIFIYCTSVLTFIEIRKYIFCVNFNEDFWRSRQPTLSISYIIAFLFVLYILNPGTLFLSNILGVQSIIPLFVNDIADILIFLMLFPRAWILWFDRAFYDNLKNWLWRRELNPKDTNFMVQHRAILKSTHVLVYSFYLILVAPMFTILKVLPYLNVYPITCDVILTCLLIVLLCSTVRIAHKISVVFDEHHIRSELLGTVKTACVAYIIGHFLHTIFESQVDIHWALLLEILCVCIADLSVIYWACHYARHKYEFIQKVRLVKTLKATLVRRQSFTALLTKRIQFQDIMDHRNGIESFCHHLQNEFGLESILFLLEVTQFKAVIRRVSDNVIEDNVPKLCQWHMTENHLIAKKHVFSATSILDIHWLPIDPRMYTLSPHQIALHLYDKYVEESADLCINISFGIRKGIYRYFQEYAVQTPDFIDTNGIEQLMRMYNVYDRAFTEVWRLIQTDSFLRFKSTDDFRRLAAVLFPEAAKEANQHLSDMVDHAMQMEQQREREQEAAHSSMRTAPDMMPPFPMIHISDIRPKLLRNGSTSPKSTHGLSVNPNNDYVKALTSIAELEEPHTPILAQNKLQNRNAHLPTLSLERVGEVQRSLPPQRSLPQQTLRPKTPSAYYHTVVGSPKLFKPPLTPSNSLPLMARFKKNNYRKPITNKLKKPSDTTLFNRLYSDSRSKEFTGMCDDNAPTDDNTPIDKMPELRLAVPTDSMSELK